MTQEIPEITLRRLIEREIDNVMKCSSCHETLSELERVWSFAGSATDRAPLTDVVVSMVRPKTSRFHGNIDIDRRLDGIKDEYDRSEDDYSIEKHWSCHNCGEEVDIEHRAEHALRVEPLGLRLAARVEVAQRLRAGEPGARGQHQDLLQVVEEVVLAAVELQ